jgi:hypothetical protein
MNNEGAGQSILKTAGQQSENMGLKLNKGEM